MHNLGFIGCGNMGAAMVKSLLDEAVFKSEEMIIVEKIPNVYTDEFARRGIKVLNKLQDLDENIKIAILAVKPQDAGQLLSEISHLRIEIDVVISIMAGISVEKIEKS